MSRKSTLVLVPGAWHCASTWVKVASLLENLAVQMRPSGFAYAGSSPSACFLDDVKAVRCMIIVKTTKGRDAVVVVNSYGGLVGSSANIGLTHRKDDDPEHPPSRSGHVIGIIMLATGFAAAGMSMLRGLDGKPPPFWKVDSQSGFAVLTVDPRRLFYQELPVQEGNYWVEKLANQSLKSMMEGGEHVYEGWRDVPVCYVATTEDKALPVEAQRMFVQKAKDAGADVTLREVASGHSPMLSKPDNIFTIMLEAMAYFAT
ncbi:Alpha/beta hydrolase fold-1 [Xylariales sp. AK1849]|nr:Alpha/beta hydrolase fold-1 [Xylariales sp. AK1849]